MAQDLQTSSSAALPAVDVHNPESLLSLPPWLAKQIAAVSDLGYGRTLLDPVTKAIIGQVATIPRSKMPTGPQRAAIAQRIEELHAASMPGPLASTLSVIGSIVSRNTAARQDEDLASIEIEAYRDALDDLPAWTVREALRRWRRGEVGGNRRDLDFPPKEHRLRQIALGVESAVRGQIIRLQRLLEAEADDSLTSEERSDIVRRAQAATRVTPGSDVEPSGVEARERAEAERDLARRKVAIEVAIATAPADGLADALDSEGHARQATDA